jgi:hypothetical protein
MSLFLDLMDQLLFEVLFSLVFFLWSFFFLFLLCPEDFLNGFHVSRSISAKTFEIDVFNGEGDSCHVLSPSGYGHQKDGIVFERQSILDTPRVSTFSCSVIPIGCAKNPDKP